jgi:hypothetical protein
MALALLVPNEQDEVRRLTELYRTPDGDRYAHFSAACTFADLARSKASDGIPGWRWFSRFNDWHFLNAPRTARQIEEKHCGEDCVLTAIEYHSSRLANHGSDEQRRARALLFLGHWIGDVHQPLHVSYHDDLGGNRIKPIRGGYFSDDDLHAVWDTGIIRRARGSKTWLEYATELRGAITPEQRAEWIGGTPLDWARESYAITTRQPVDYCEWEGTGDEEACVPEGKSRRLDASYESEFRSVVERRLQQAAVRLADQIRSAL